MSKNYGNICSMHNNSKVLDEMELMIKHGNGDEWDVNSAIKRNETPRMVTVTKRIVIADDDEDDDDPMNDQCPECCKPSWACTCD